MRNYKPISQSSTSENNNILLHELFMFFDEVQVFVEKLYYSHETWANGTESTLGYCCYYYYRIVLFIVCVHCIICVYSIHAHCTFFYKLKYYSKNNNDCIIIYLLYYCGDCLYRAENRFQNSL